MAAICNWRDCGQTPPALFLLSSGSCLCNPVLEQAWSVSFISKNLIVVCCQKGPDTRLTGRLSCKIQTNNIFFWTFEPSKRFLLCCAALHRSWTIVYASNAHQAEQVVQKLKRNKQVQFLILKKRTVCRDELS